MNLRRYFAEDLEQRKKAAQEHDGVLIEYEAGMTFPRDKPPMPYFSKLPVSATDVVSAAEQLLKDFTAGKLKVPKEDTKKAFIENLQEVHRDFLKAANADVVVVPMRDVVLGIIRANEDLGIRIKMTMDKLGLDKMAIDKILEPNRNKQWVREAKQKIV